MVKFYTCYNTSRTPINNSNTPVFIPIVSYTPIFTLIEAFTLAQISVSDLPGIYTDEDL